MGHSLQSRPIILLIIIPDASAILLWLPSGLQEITGDGAKASSAATGRLQPLRLFAALLASMRHKSRRKVSKRIVAPKKTVPVRIFVS